MIPAENWRWFRKMYLRTTRGAWALLVVVLAIVEVL
jgi:hypothetical protein